MDYLLIHPGKTNEHTQQHVVASSIGTPENQLLTRDEAMQIAADLQAPQEAWGVDVSEGHIWQCSLSIKQSEGLLPDQKWQSISKDFMQEMGMPDDLRWVSVRHGVSVNGNDHVHIAANVVRENGALADTWNDFYRSQQVCAKLETQHNLEPLQRTSARALSRSELKHHGEPERFRLERQVRAAASVATADSEFFHELEMHGIKVRPYIQDGQVTGYSVALPEKNAQRFAGGKLARDLSLPRLQATWKNNVHTKTSHIRAVQELQNLQHTLPKADALQLEDASHQLAGALAQASLVEEGTVPGPLAAASRQAGAYAQTVRAHLRPKPPALSVGLLLMQSTDPTGPVGKAVMIKQLMAAYRALLDAQFARRALVTSRERTPSMTGQAGPEEELLDMGITTTLTAGALVVEHHARAKEAAAEKTRRDPNKDLWDAKKIRQFRKDEEATIRAKAGALKPPPGTEMFTPEQRVRAAAAAKALDMPSVVTLAESMTAREAEIYLANIEANVVTPVKPYVPPLDPETFEAKLEAKHGQRLTPAEEFVEKYATPQTPTAVPDMPYGGPGQRQPQGPAEQLAAELNKPETWRTGDAPATDAQVKWLSEHGGLTREEAAKMTKAGASSYRNSLERNLATGVHLTPAQNGPKQTPGKYTRGR